MPRARHVMITGASRGLGRALALAFACKGATIGIHCAHNAPAAEETAAAVRNLHACAYIVQADLARDHATAAIATAVCGASLPLDVLVLNAGMAGVARLADVTETLWDEVMAVNYRSHVRLVAALENSLRPGSHVLAVASLVGLRGAVGLTPYAASKGALLGYVRDAAARLGARGILVNAVIPGLMQTDMTGAVSSATYATLASENVLGRANTIEEIARAAAFITSLEGVSGHAFSLDSRLYPDGRCGVETGIV